MTNPIQMVRRVCVVGVVGALASLSLAAAASAHSGDFARFNYCPSTNAEVFKCLYSETTGGSIVLGKKTTPIVNPVTLQGGYSSTNAAKEHISSFFAATNGETLSKTPEPVPGGLLGIVPPESSGWLVKELSKFFFENGLTGVNATLELAQPASSIKISEYNLELEEGLALKLPVKVHLENPFLGSSCYVGSSSSPIIWNLTTGETAPPGPNKSIKGSSGIIELKDEFELAELKENVLVENAWSAPEATGCGGVVSFLVDPIIDSTIGVPSAAGTNSATLINNISIATKASVNAH
jgi:hypothetical protein